VLEIGVRRRGEAAALRLRLVAAHRGLPAGTEIVVGVASATGSPRPVAPLAGPLTAAPQTARTVELRRVVAVHLTPAGHAFPVSRATAVADTYGDLRAGVGWHHGVDLFAPRGTPVVAIASGTLFEVGWNPRGGHRVWLRDSAGNTYYYAHLDTYTPAARNGARVRAGQPLGTVGASGDAERTPPHLHFEVHPAGLADLGYDGAVDPTPYLRAWAAGRDLTVAATPPAPPVRVVASRPAAFLLAAEDILWTGK
jgi:murein DD-endopeptidase MepM/ murein hydrolase activator NlpD